MSRARDIIEGYGLEEAMPFANFKSRVAKRAGQAKSFGQSTARKAKESGAYKKAEKTAKFVRDNPKGAKRLARMKVNKGRRELNKRSGVLRKDVKDVGSSIKKGWQKLTKTEPLKRPKDGVGGVYKGAGFKMKNPKWSKPGSRKPTEKVVDVHRSRSLVPTGKRGR